MDTYVGSEVFARCPRRSWILCKLETYDPLRKTGNCRAVGDNDLIVGVIEENIYPIRGNAAVEEVDDLLLMTELHDATLLNTIKRRYMKDVIYTNIGAIVVALNPFNFKIPRYLDSMMPHYLAEGPMVERNVPHSWACAHNTFYEMRSLRTDQSILVSGESGAGKTEASKIVMKYLAAVSSLRGEAEHREAAQLVGKKINASSPALEAFGNAKTVRNDNSSRFGKFMRIKFNDGGFLTGAHITKYLLEKSRIVTASPGERIYHAFYLLLHSNHVNQYYLLDDKSYVSASAGGTFNNVEYDTNKDFEEVCASMRVTGIDDASIDSLWRVVAGILHLENAKFEADGESNTVVPSSNIYIQNAAKLWGIDEEKYRAELRETTLMIMGNPVKRNMNVAAAMDARSALNKALYDGAFSWLVEQCNKNLDVPDHSNWIGLLDIFGFEDFQLNSFEQLCINLANETLQHHYNTYIFQKDIEECRAEGVDCSSVPFPDNTPCLTMISGAGGIMALLDDECNLGQGTDAAFFSKVCSKFAKHEFFELPRMSRTNFVVKHYAGHVSYNTTNFREKNMDTLKDAWKVLLRASTNPLIQTLLPAPKDAKGPRITVSGYFRAQLKELMELINSTNPHWIRCIKPHPAKKPLMFDGTSVMNQLASSGVLGTVRIRKAGYAVRLPLATFVASFKIIARVKGLPETAHGIVQACEYTKDEAQVGTKRAFLRSHIYIDIEAKKQKALLGSTVVVQSFARGSVAYQGTKRLFGDQNEKLISKLRVQVQLVIDTQRRELQARRKLWADQAAAMRALSAKVAPSLQAVREVEEKHRRQELEKLVKKHHAELACEEHAETSERALITVLSEDAWAVLARKMMRLYREALDRQARLQHRESEAALMSERRQIREERRAVAMERLFSDCERRMDPLFQREDRNMRIIAQQSDMIDDKYLHLEQSVQKEQQRTMHVLRNREEYAKRLELVQEEKQLKAVKNQQRVAETRIARERFERVMTEDFEWQRLEQRLLQGQRLALEQQRRTFIQEKAIMDQERRNELKAREENIRNRKLRTFEKERSRSAKLDADREAERKAKEREAFEGLVAFREKTAMREKARVLERSAAWDNDRQERMALLRADIPKAQLGLHRLADRVGAPPPVVMVNEQPTYSTAWVPFRVIKVGVAPSSAVAPGAPFTVSWMCSGVPTTGSITACTGNGVFARYTVKKAAGEVVLIAPKEWFSEIQVIFKADEHEHTHSIGKLQR